MEYFKKHQEKIRTNKELYTLKIMKRAGSLRSNFTGSYKRVCILETILFYLDFLLRDI